MTRGSGGRGKTRGSGGRKKTRGSGRRGKTRGSGGRGKRGGVEAPEVSESEQLLFGGPLRYDMGWNQHRERFWS